MVYAIPIYAYVTASTPEDARIQKAKIEKLLANPLVKMQMSQAGISFEGFIVQDPVPAPPR